ncbi:MAG TPA: SDR family NAD(P)-dependent oxidoreductase [Dongiaceae bacterium]|nr:SDR family NAD(P)-dependent oxidoreductase [Dongiaceae bacterium]
MTYRCALITGASSGIGEAFARALPRSTSLLLTGRDRTKLAHLASELANGERSVRSIAADLATAEGRQAVIGFAEDQAIDLLINNAGIGQLGRVVDNPPERESEMAQLNMLAPVELTRALLPGLLKRSGEGRHGGVIFVASAAAFLPVPLFATYAASKAFLLHYAEALAGELSDSPVDILALCPGATSTRFFERASIARPASLLQMHDADRVAREGLQALGRRVVHVVGPSNYLMTAAARLLPRRLVAAAAERAMRRFRGQ